MIDGSASKHRLKLFVTSVSFVLLVASAGARGAAPAGESWQQHTVLLAFHNLPKRYTCDQLRRRVGDVLLHLGVRSDVQVTASRCEPMLGVAARSPRVRVRFFAPAPGGTAGTREVRIEPGAPASIDATDCALVRQMLPSLPGKVLGYRLACRAPSTARPAFTVTVRAVFPGGVPLQAEAGSPRG
ncbi:MAG TPA: hypothetical protein VFS52_18475 [Steroidobacteraceae bacterium]|jgi:hypothetical protein|nr:hypothetical protein [Steroidobacteraceae bacterium]